MSLGSDYVKMSRTFTAEENCDRLLLGYYAGSSNYVLYNPETIMIEENDEITDFGSFGTATTISFPTAAGTVYGGTLTIYENGTGKLTSTMAEIASYNGEALPGAWISDRDVYDPEGTPTTGARVVYELAEPVAYDLSAAEVNAVITSLGGLNNVYADSGDILYIRYHSQ